MPPIRFSASKYYTLLAVFISLNGEIISPYSYYAKKGLVYIIIIFSFSHQPSFYLKYTKANTRLLYDMRLVPFNKYIFSCRCIRLCIYCSFLVLWLSYRRVLGLFCC